MSDKQLKGGRRGALIKTTQCTTRQTLAPHNIKECNRTVLVCMSLDHLLLSRFSGTQCKRMLLHLSVFWGQGCLRQFTRLTGQEPGAGRSQ
jgi:hypothetical protein